MFFVFFLLMFNFMFSKMKHQPLTLGLILIMQTFIICLLMGIMSQSFWFSYILFLVFIGGVLIMFIYVISLISNEKFFTIKKSMFLNIMFFFMIIIMMKIIDNKFYDSFFNNELTKLTNNKQLFYENSLNLNKLYNFPTNMINLLLINYLFLMLIITVKITKFFHGPLRMKN